MVALNTGTANKPRNDTRQIWRHMLSRCHNPTNSAYRYYGARGIVVCARWKDFELFLSDMGYRPQGTSIDRIDNNRNYEPSNCRWATGFEQANNTRKNRLITVGKKTQTLQQWCNQTGLAHTTVHNRLGRLGWSAADAINTPARPINRKKR